MSARRPWTILALIAVVAPACQKAEREFLITQNQFTTRIVGRVVDEATRQPIAAQVTVCGVGQTTADAAGNFAIDVPGVQDTTVAVVVSAPGYATFGETFSISADPDFFDGSQNSVDLTDLGTIDLVRGQNLSVVVTGDGTPLPNATAFALLEGLTGGGKGGSKDASCEVEIVGRTDASGVAELLNLDPRQNYEIIVPSQDLDGIPGADFGSASTSHQMASGGSVVAVNVTSVGTHTSPILVGENLRLFPAGGLGFFQFPTGPIVDNTGPVQFQSPDVGSRSSLLDEPVAFSRAATTADGSVRVVFRTPVDIMDGVPGVEPHFQFFNNLMDPAAPSFGQVAVVPATAVELAGSLGTVYTLAPASALPANESLALRFFARSRSSLPVTQNLDIPLYRPVQGNVSLGVQLDNYNGSQDGSGGASPVFLEFDEAVQGSYKVVQVIDGATTTTFSSSVEQPVGSGDFGQTDGFDSMAFNANSAPSTGDSGSTGATPGTRYRVRLRNPSTGGDVALNDSVPVTFQGVTLVLSVRDAEGITLSQTVTLPIR